MFIYMATVIGSAAFFLWHAINGQGGEIDKAAVGALIAIFGTMLTAIGALYTANRQASVTREVEELRRNTAQEMAFVGKKITQDLDAIKHQSNMALERLKVFLAAGRTAYDELFGAAAKYFYALRSASTRWDDKLLDDAEDFMRGSLRHIIYVNAGFREDWMGYWQAATHIRQECEREQDPAVRPTLIPALVLEKTGPDRRDLRERLALLERAAKQAMDQEIAPESTRFANQTPLLRPIHPTSDESWTKR